MVGGEGLANRREAHRIPVGNLAVQFTVALRQGQNLVLVHGLLLHEPPELNRDGTPDSDDLLQILPLEVHEAGHKTALRFIQCRQERLPAIAGEGRADREIRIAHRGNVLHVEGSEVGRVAFGAEIHVGIHRTRIPTEHLAGIRHDGHMRRTGETPFIHLIRPFRPGGRVIEDHLAQIGLLLVVQRPDDATQNLGALITEQSVNLEDSRRVFHHRLTIQGRGPDGDIARQLAAERLDQWKALVGQIRQQLLLLLGQRDQLSLLFGSQDIQNIVGSPRHKGRVMPQLIDIHVAHVLEAEEIGGFPRRQERAASQIAGQKGQAVEGNRVKLCPVRDRLLDRVLTLTTRPLASGLGATASVLCLGNPTLRLALVSVIALPLPRPRREVAQLVRIAPSRLDRVVQRRAAAESRLPKRLMDRSGLVCREGVCAIL